MRLHFTSSPALRKALLVAAGLCLFSANTPALAAVADPPPAIPDTCDANYYDVLRARSYVEGKREMETAQRLILKQDSVLEYSCFHEDLINVGTEGGRFSEYGLRTGTPPAAPLFDGTDPPTRIYPNSLEDALDAAVYDSLIGFLESFSHIYGGGSFAVAVNPIAGCNPMNVVWHASQCQNFNPGWWVRLEDLADNDIRIFPVRCDETGRSDAITTALEASYPAPTAGAASGGINIYRSFRDQINDCSAARAIPTGLTLRRNDGTTISEAVCIVPGCYYNGSRCTE